MGESDQRCGWFLGNGEWPRYVLERRRDCEPGLPGAGIGDYNGDGTDDILWRNPTTGDTPLFIAQMPTSPEVGLRMYASR
jgi:FG-GAP repeat